MFYDSYVIERTGKFDSISYNQQVTYEVFIYKKNGANIRPAKIIFGKDPIIIRTLNDDVFGIKGTEAELTILNINNSSPLSHFYSDEDDTYKIEINARYGTASLIYKNIFTGFLIQEDCSEVLQDWGHEIKLSFTDGLGSLKYIPFGDAAKSSPVSPSSLRLSTSMISIDAETTTESQTVKIYDLGSYLPAVNDSIVFLNSPIGSTSYIIKKATATRRGIDLNSHNVTILYFTEPYKTFTANTSKIALLTPSDPYSRIRLADVLRICLHATNMNLPIKFGNIMRVMIDNIDYNYLNETYVDGRSFLSDENKWKDCYTILSEILERFQLSLFQYDGFWHLMRWNELRYVNNQLSYITYDSYFNPTGSGNYASAEIDMVETGLQESFLRPYNYYIDNLNYKNFNNILLNSKMQEIGLKHNEYTEVVNGITLTCKEYFLQNWEGQTLIINNQTKTFYGVIKISYNNLGQEVERVICVRMISATGLEARWASRAIKAKTIDCKIGDKFTFSFETRSDVDYDDEPFYMNIKLSNGTQNYYLDFNTNENEENNWLPSEPNPKIGNWIDWSHFEFKSAPFPIEGSLTIHLSQNGYEPAFFRNLNFEYIYNLNKINISKGHIHNSKQDKVIKNNKTTEITIDDTLKNNISGTLFINSFTNTIQDRTNLWSDGKGNYASLGKILSLQMEDWRCRIRTKLEGKILGIINKNGDWMALHCPLIFDVKSGKYFIFGKAEYNLKEDYISATLYEMWQDGEDRSTTGITGNSDLSYEFKFLYK